MDAIRLNAKGVLREQTTEELTLMFPIQRSDRWKALRLLELAPENIEITVREAKKHRSLDQNAYFWALVGEIATKIGASNYEVYLAVLESYTKPERMVIRKAARDMLLKEPFRIIKFEQDVEGGMAAAQCWVSSKYLDTKEFSHLLDMTLEEAKQVGIDPEAVKLGLLDDKAY